MAKRFTDNDKWDDPWFAELSINHKLLWLFILDKCDHGGIYKVNKKMAEFCIGEKIDWLEFKELLNGRITEISPEKWFIDKFIDFQYGVLSENCKPHQPVIKILKSLGLYEKYKKKGYLYPLNRVKEQDQDKEQEKEQEIIITESEIEAFKEKKFFKKPEKLEAHLKGRGVDQEQIVDIINKVFNKKEITTSST